MRIGIVYFADYPPKTGASGADRRIRDIVRGLVAQGHQAHMLVPRRSFEQDRLDVDGYEVVYLGPVPSNSAVSARDRLKFWRDMLAFSGQSKLDWVLLYGGRIDAAMPALALRRKGIKVAAEFCDLRSSGFKRDSVWAWANWASLRLDEAVIPRVTDLNIAISRYLVDHVQTRAPRTPALRLPVLVDTDLFTPTDAAAKKANERWNIPDDAVVFAYVGGLWKQEGVKYLVEAFSKVANVHPNSRLIIAGRLVNSPNHDDIAGLVEELQLEQSVITPGWVTTEDVVSVYSRADVLVLPQINDKFAVAALPTKLAEYGNIGKAIIATRVGDVPVYFEDGRDALLVESESASELTAAMLRVIEETGLRERLGPAARVVAAKNFDFREAGRRITEQMHLRAAQT